MNGWDAAIAAWFEQRRVEFSGVARWAALISDLGGAAVTLGASLIATLWLVARRMPRSALLLAATILSVRLGVEWQKYLFGRPRPQLEHLPASLAFPSGHSANSMTTYLAIAIIAVPVRHRRVAIVAALAITLIVGTARLAEGVHWTSDVLGGWTLGLLAVSLAETIRERSGALLFEAQHDVVARHGSAIEQGKTP